MRRLGIYLAAGVLLLLALAPLWLLGTTSGLDWVLRFAERKVPILVEGPHGSLWSGVGLKRFVYADKGLTLKLQDVYLRASWGCVLRRTLCVEEASVQTMVITLPDVDPKPENAKPLAAPLPWLPLLVDIESLSVAHLALQKGDAKEVINDVFLSGEVGRERLLLAEFSAEHLRLDWRGGGSLSRSGRWDVAFDMVLATEDISSWPRGLENRYALTMRGDLSDLQGELRGQSGSPALKIAVGREPSGFVTLNGSLEDYFEPLQTVVPALKSYKNLEADGPLTFRAGVADAQNLSVSFGQSLAGLSPQTLDLEINLQQTSERWELTSATIGDSAGSALKVSGPLGELAALTPMLRFDARRFQVPLPSEGRLEGRLEGQGDGPKIAFSGAGQITFSVPNLLETLAIATPRIDIQIDDKAGFLSGDIRATDVPMLPSGSLSGAFDGVPFTYERATTSAAPAQLSLPDGIPIEGLEISRLRATVLPGVSTGVSLVSEGDFRGELNLAASKTDKGARFVIDPFLVFLRDEAIRSENAVSGEWISQSSTIVLEQYCLAWRNNSACGDSARLGQSGTLSLALKVDENVQGAVSEKPFSLEAKGAGALQLEWSVGALVEADFDLNFASLAVDPFMHEGTARPIQWERARASGSLRPNARQLSLGLESERVGTLALTLNEEGEELKGSLQATGIDLASLDDVLPEWTLRSGAIEADLTVAGSRARPQVFGQLVLDDAAAQHPDLDTSLSEVRLVLDAQGDSFTLNATSLLGGRPLALTGVCCEDEILAAQLQGSRNMLRIPRVGVEATISPRLDMQLTRQSLSVGGEVTVHSGVLQHAGPTDDAVALSDDFYRTDAPQASPRRFDVGVDVRALIEPGFTLRSKELEATLSGDVTVNLKPEVPTSLYGELQVLGGELRAYGQVLRLTQGSVGFVGDPINPALNLSAERRIRAEDLRVGFHVRGSLEEPTFEIFSDPVRSERDTLSYLLRGRGPDAGASVDGTAMALSLGASALNQSGALESLNSIPGLSGVSLGAEGSDDDMAATISAYVGERLYLSYGVGIYEPVNALTARLYLRSRLWLEVVSRLESSFDLYYRFDIE